MARRRTRVRMPFGRGPVAVFTRRLVVLCVVVLGLIWGWLQVDRRTLGGIRVAGMAVPRTGAPKTWLREKAAAWEAQTVTIRIGHVETDMRRRQLGARRPVDELAGRMVDLGRSGNPFVDIWSWWEATRRGRDFPWSPEIDQGALARFVKLARQQIERSPVVGTIDEEGWRMEGIPGRTLNSVNAIALLQKALSADSAFVELAVREIPPPDPILIGPPDAAVFADEPEIYSYAAGGKGVMRAVPPPSLRWAPDRGRECFPAGRYRAFCQGPRRVPEPYGRAAALADRLKLGDITMIGRLFSARPDPAWVRYAGPVPRTDLLWPVPGGRFVRGFGYVRRASLRHKLHKGVDIAAPVGAAIAATKGGIVAYADNTIRGYGNLLAIVHGDATVSTYAHCSAIYVFAGQKVTRGQIVAEVGSTGISLGPHLHFEYRVDGRPVDPQSLLVKDGVFTVR